jgi:hypothetical protein
MAVQQMAALGRMSARPRHWMCDTKAKPGTAFIYYHQRPGVALVVRDGCIRTVLTRWLTRGAAERRRQRAREQGSVLRSVRPPAVEWEEAA